MYLYSPRGRIYGSNFELYITVVDDNSSWQVANKPCEFGHLLSSGVGRRDEVDDRQVLDVLGLWVGVRDIAYGRYFLACNF